MMTMTTVGTTTATISGASLGLQQELRCHATRRAANAANHPDSHARHGCDPDLASTGSRIALAGLDAEAGMVMLLYLHNSYDHFKAEGPMNSLADLKAAIHEGAVLRIRTKTMTVMTTMMGLVPIMIGTGTGSDVMKRMATPMFGGLLTSFTMELLI